VQALSVGHRKCDL